MIIKEPVKILKDFPNLELSYEKKLHKKVQSDIYLIIYFFILFCWFFY